MDKINLKLVRKWGIVFTAFLILFATPIGLLSNVFAQGQETCPATGDWIKIEGLSGTTFTYTAPEGKLVAETCYKASTEVVFETINPPQSSVTVTSTVGHDLSHASFRLVDEPEPTPTNTPTDPPTPTPTNTPTDPPTPTPTNTPTFTPTPPFTPTPTFTSTPTFTPTPTFTSTPTEELEYYPLTLEGLCSGSLASIAVTQADENTISWRVSNANSEAVSFNWTANNGQSGSGTAPAYGSTTFITEIDGFSVSLEYTLNNEPVEELASVEPCEPEQETEEPTPTPTATEEPTPAPTDSEPDQPAGGSGPSAIRTFAPIVFGLAGVATLITIAIDSKIKQRIN